MPRKIISLRDRLNSRLVRKGDCLIWTGSLAGGGYKDGKGHGRIYIGPGAIPKYKYCHIVAYEFAYGPVPPGKIICHTCDVAACCEPRHLYAGTYQTNSDDKWTRGRDNRARGEKYPQSKLTETDIPEIRRLRLIGLSQQKIADKFGVSQVLIGKVLRGEAWTHI